MLSESRQAVVRNPSYFSDYDNMSKYKSLLPPGAMPQLNPHAPNNHLLRGKPPVSVPTKDESGSDSDVEVRRPGRGSGRVAGAWTARRRDRRGPASVTQPSIASRRPPGSTRNVKLDHDVLERGFGATGEDDASPLDAVVRAAAAATQAAGLQHKGAAKAKSGADAFRLGGAIAPRTLSGQKALQMLRGQHVSLASGPSAPAAAAERVGSTARPGAYWLVKSAAALDPHEIKRFLMDP